MNIKTYYLLVISVAAIQIQLSKKNICILSNSQFISNIVLNKTNVELIPTTISLQTFVTNTIPSFADYFDSFYFLT